MGTSGLIKTDVIWIDPCIDNKENTDYINALNLKDSLKVKSFKNVDEALNYLKK